MVKKVFIIALDGLEPSLVNPTMPNITQKYYGTTVVNVHPLQTPVLWGAFLTGTTDNGIKGMKRHNRLTETLSRILGYERVTKLMAKLKIQTATRLYTKKDLTKPTIFDLVPKTIAISVPAYNEPEIYLEIRRETVEAIGDRYKTLALLLKVWKLFNIEYEETLWKLKTDWNLFMVHFFVTDTIGHLYWNNPERIKKCYRLIDRKIKYLKESVDDETLVLIVSDHGLKKGLHTPKGFWSTNIDLNLKNPKITDFYNIIKKVVEK